MLWTAVEIVLPAQQDILALEAQLAGHAHKDFMLPNKSLLINSMHGQQTLLPFAPLKRKFYFNY